MSLNPGGQNTGSGKPRPGHYFNFFSCSMEMVIPQQLLHWITSQSHGNVNKVTGECQIVKYFCVFANQGIFFPFKGL